MNKVVVVTGCNRGAGKGIKDVLLANGYHVYGLNKTPSTEFPENYTEIPCNISDVDSVQNALTLLPEKIDLLIANAGIRRFDEVENMSSDNWKISVDVNLNGAFYIIKGLIPKLKENKGDIVVVGSHSEKYSFEGGSAYCASKKALKGLTDCLVDELRYHDVRVTYLSIGSIKNRDHGYDESWKLEPEDIGKSILSIVTLPKKVLIPYMDLRPIKPMKDHLSGMERLQYV